MEATKLTVNEYKFMNWSQVDLNECRQCVVLKIMLLGRKYITDGIDQELIKVEQRINSVEFCKHTQELIERRTHLNVWRVRVMLLTYPISFNTRMNKFVYDVLMNEDEHLDLDHFVGFIETRVSDMLSRVLWG